MKPYIYPLVVNLLLLCSQSLLSQGTTREDHQSGFIHIKQDRAEVINDSVYWDMVIQIQGIVIGNNQSLLLTPVIYSQQDSITLQPVLLNGSKKHILYTRTQYFDKKALSERSYKTLKNRSKELITISYKDTIPYSDWMQNSGLKLTGEYKDLQDRSRNTITDVLAEKINLQ